jgi:hypothetical protein
MKLATNRPDLLSSPEHQRLQEHYAGEKNWLN